MQLLDTSRLTTISYPHHDECHPACAAAAPSYERGAHARHSVAASPEPQRPSSPTANKWWGDLISRGQDPEQGTWSERRSSHDQGRHLKRHRLRGRRAGAAPLHAPRGRSRRVTGRSEAGKKLAAVFPHLASLRPHDRAESSTGSVDFVFSALPHAASAEACAPLVRAGVPVVDISADFRLNDAAEYAEWYGGEHPAPELAPAGRLRAAGAEPRRRPQRRSSSPTRAATRRARSWRWRPRSRRGSSRRRSSSTRSPASPAQAAASR